MTISCTPATPEVMGGMETVVEEIAKLQPVKVSFHPESFQVKVYHALIVLEAKV